MLASRPPNPARPLPGRCEHVKVNCDTWLLAALPLYPARRGRRRATLPNVNLEKDRRQRAAGKFGKHGLGEATPCDHRTGRSDEDAKPDLIACVRAAVIGLDPCHQSQLGKEH